MNRLPARHARSNRNHPRPHARRAGAWPSFRGDAVTNHRLALLTVTLLAAVVLAAGSSRAEISEPDHIIYGTPTWHGDALPEGTVSLVLEGGTTPIASFAIGSDPTLGALYVLRVPMDSVDPRRQGAARTGDPASLLVNGELAGTVVIGERGTAQLMNVDPEDVDTTPALSVGDVAVTEGDVGTVDAVFTITLSVAIESPVTVDWVTENGTAAGGATCGGAVDFVARSGTATVNPGDLTTTVAIAVCGETLEESDESFYLNLLNPTGAALLDPQGKGTIVDDDTPPTLSVANVTVTEPPSGSVMASFRVSLNHTWDQQVQFGYATTPGTADPGLDYLSASGTGLIEPGLLQTTVTVEVLADTLNEEDETFFLDLQAPVQASILDGQGQCIIVDGAQFLLYVESLKDGVAGVDGLAAAFSAAVSPDGAHVYVVGRSEDAIAVFARDPASGSLAFIRAYTPADFQNRYTEAFVGLDAPESVLVSPDSAHVYVAAYNHDAVAVFERDPLTGLLGLLEVERDGVNDLSDPGGTVNGLDGATALAISPDGRTLYVAASAESAVAVFNRDDDPASLTYGRLVFSEAELDGVDDPSDLGGLVDGLHLASAVAVSPDGADVYVTGPGDNAVAVFDRDTDPSSGSLGRLSFLQVHKDGVSGVDGLAGATGVALPPDGAHVYAAGPNDDAVAAFARAADGSLTWLQVTRNGAGTVDGLTGANAIAASQDNGYLYATGYLDNALVVLQRDPAAASPTFGRLSFVEVKRDGIGGVDGLFGANWVAVSADDASVYVTADLDNAVAAFVRDLNPPTDPTTLVSTTHTPGVWSNVAVVGVEWSGAADAVGGAGVAGYSVLFDAVADTVPDAAVDVLHTLDPHATASAPLVDGTHYFHLRTCDHAANCSAGIHLGELLVDLSPPLAPTDLVSLSHVVGVPNADMSIDMAWTAATDAGNPPSGIAGYSYTFNTSATPVCNLELDLDGSAVAVTSPDLEAGVYYFHLCARDVAGSWGPTATAGPFEVVDDSVPPRVLWVSSVSAPPGGTIAGGDPVEHGITQIRVAFSKAMSDPGGDTDPLDVTNPAAYLLVAGGPDGVADSDACSGAVDDLVVPLTEVTYDPATLVATVHLDTPTALPMGIIGLSLCGTGLADINANLLDGDGDGAGGDSFLTTFRVMRDNLLVNPNLDQDLSGWALSSLTDIAYDTSDVHDLGSSGSAQVSRSTGDPTDYSLSQCVDLTGLDGPPFYLSGAVRIEESLGGDPGAATALGRVVLRDGPGCSGAQVGGEVTTNAVVDDTAGEWQPLTARLDTLPAGTLSALVSFSLTLPPGEDFPLLAWFDTPLFQHDDLTPPVDPPTLFSTSHVAGAWSTVPVVAMQWDEATDSGVGIAGYSFLFDTVETTVPDDTLDLEGAGGLHATSSAALADGVYYFHIRTCDHAANCSAGVSAGWYGVDTTPPANPAGLASTSHSVGVPSAVSVVDMAWTPAVDNPPAPSGAVGYSLLFDQSLTGEPDLVVDLPVDATGVSSQPFASGTYYFHLRTLDLAGNWSETTTTGPYVVNDTVPPVVLDVTSTAAPRDGWLDDGDATFAGITQLVATLSEPVQDPAGDTVPDDVTNPANYRVVSAGIDGALETTDCLSVQGDDLLLAIEGVAYDLATDQVAVNVGTASLAEGPYRFLACGSTTIVDPSDNPLDGDGDGVGGDDFAVDFQVLATNLLINPNLDANLAVWTPDPVPPSQFVLGAEDADGSLFSGSAEVSNQSGPDASHELSQCVAVTPAGVAFSFGGRVRLDRTGAGLPAAGIALEVYGQASCAGPVLATLPSVTVSGDTGGAWEDLETSPTALTAAARSVRLVLIAAAGPDPSADFVAAFDNLAVRRWVVLFADGFESGGTTVWTSTAP